ncbi:MAG: hypothetical protein FWD31_12070 [Planctomycetaceae bacterium]|nr:hypothetical protein [Planctomycetaceae bacterium]
MSRHHFYYAPPSGKDVQAALRRGLTLVEILIAVALMTFIMLAAVQVLSYVSSSLNQAQNAMVIASRARTAQLQIERDLRCITAPLTPPLRFDDAQGYFCYIEGLGAHYGNLYHQDKDGNYKIGWGVEDIAVNSETGEYDSTIGDCDDILMFTARAPEGSMYRGLVGGKIMESKEAEICYFLRGTTLYRRVLLIIPDEQLQVELNKTEFAFISDGMGFYRHFDVSARLEWNANTSRWRIKANTLADLTRRENRFGHSNFGRNANPTTEPLGYLKTGSGAIYLPFPYGIHFNAAWYQLRLPTLAECTTAKHGFLWRAGKQIVTTNSNFDKLDDKLLYLENNSSCASFPNPDGGPYIDFWDQPLPWRNLTDGYLTPSSGNNIDIFETGNDTYANFAVRENDDVLLTNVIGFDIKVWCPIRKEFIDLGQFRNYDPRDTNTPNFELAAANPSKAREFSKDFRSQGFYGATHNAGTVCYGNDGTFYYGILSCVYDTWTDAYEIDATGSIFDANDAIIEGIGVDPAFDGLGMTDIMDHVDQWRCPPPYNTPLTGIQITIRVFDPDTNNIREVTIRKNFN